MREKSQEKETSSGNKNLNVVIYLIGMFIAVIVILGGVSIMLGDGEDDDDQDGTGITEANQAYIDLMTIHIADQLAESQHAVKAIATSPNIAWVFTNASQAELDRADGIIDNYRTMFNVTVVYLMNETGMTIASTNRDNNMSFVGHNYGFRPYFQDALTGKPGQYFALGATTGTRGYHTSYPVKDSNGTIVGVVVIKKEIDFIMNAFVSKELCFLVSPEGIIFLSSENDLMMKSLWKLDQTTEDALEASGEFGSGPFENLFTTELRDGDEVAYDGKEYLVLREQVHEQGWTIVMLILEDDDDHE